MAVEVAEVLVLAVENATAEEEEEEREQRDRAETMGVVARAPALRADVTTTSA